MSEVGIRAITAIPLSRLEAPVDAGRARPARREIAEIPKPGLIFRQSWKRCGTPSGTEVTYYIDTSAFVKLVV